MPDSGIPTVRMPLPGIGVQPRNPRPLLDALEENPPTTSTFCRVNPASEGIAPRACLVRRLPSEGLEHHPDTAANW
jgi:hypothetical protein